MFSKLKLIRTYFIFFILFLINNFQEAGCLSYLWEHRQSIALIGVSPVAVISFYFYFKNANNKIRSINDEKKK